MSEINYYSPTYTKDVEEYLNYSGLRKTLSEDKPQDTPNQIVNRTFNQVYDAIDQGTMDPQGRNSMVKPEEALAKPLQFESDPIIPPPKNPSVIDPESKPGKLLTEAGTILGEHAKSTLDVLKGPGEALKGGLTDEELTKKALQMGWMLGWPMKNYPLARAVDPKLFDGGPGSISDHEQGFYNNLLESVNKMKPDMKERFKKWFEAMPESQKIEDRRPKK